MDQNFSDVRLLFAALRRTSVNNGQLSVRRVSKREGGKDLRQKLRENLSSSKNKILNVHIFASSFW